jgi:hypothetical protein
MGLRRLLLLLQILRAAPPLRRSEHSALPIMHGQRRGGGETSCAAFQLQGSFQSCKQRFTSAPSGGRNDVGLLCCLPLSGDNNTTLRSSALTFGPFPGSGGGQEPLPEWLLLAK